MAKFNSDAITNYAIGILMLFILLPIGINTFFNQTTTNWDATTVAIWNLLPILAIVAALGLLYVKHTKK